LNALAVSRQALWEEFQAKLRPVLGDEFMVSIADEIRQEGMQQGMHIKEVQIAKNFLESGFDIATVAKNTGLDVVLLKKLQEEMKH